MDALDVLIGQLLDAADANDVLVLLSSDHGGHDTSHGSYIDEDLFIPMFVKGITEVVQAQKNPSRLHPLSVKCLASNIYTSRGVVHVHVQQHKLCRHAKTKHISASVSQVRV